MIFEYYFLLCYVIVIICLHYKNVLQNSKYIISLSILQFIFRVQQLQQIIQPKTLKFPIGHVSFLPIDLCTRSIIEVNFF